MKWPPKFEYFLNTGKISDNENDWKSATYSEYHILRKIFNQLMAMQVVEFKMEEKNPS